MKGVVDAAGRAPLDVELTTASQAAYSTVTVWIDTGFTGDLVLPQSMIDNFGLLQSGTTSAVLADGSLVAMPTFACFIKWFHDEVALEVVGSNGDYPLLGVGLLLDHELRIDCRTRLIILQ
jgi:clan AA aspartic protease